jgi:hypothetical protein
VYCRMFIVTRVTLQLKVAGHGNSSKNSVHAAIAERPGVQGWALKATSSRETRQLMVKRLYFICNLTLHYADTLNQAVSGTRRPNIIWQV